MSISLFTRRLHKNGRYRPYPFAQFMSGCETAQPSQNHGSKPLSVRSRGRVPQNIWQKTNSNLHITPNHPLNTLREAIEVYMHETHPSLFTVYTQLPPIVSVKQCFDDLLVPVDHVSRQPTDTYYINDDTLLRTHMTAHDSSLLRAGIPAVLLCGDVYRRDTIDRTHYPVFHQVDSYRLYQSSHNRQEIEQDLKDILEGLARRLFGLQAQLRWVDAYFPFTTPSFELEIFWKGDWLEVLGCGLLHRNVLQRAGIADSVDGWAFGLGLERLAMVLFDIPDIRLFWSKDDRFLCQFAGRSLCQKFRPFSTYPSIEKHISFWIDGNFHEHDFYQLARAIGGDLVENVSVIDRFQKNGRRSLCFNIVFRSLHRNLTHVEINEIHERLRGETSRSLPVSLR